MRPICGRISAFACSRVSSAKPRVERCYDAVEALTREDGALLVAGSSLTVMSGLRFVRHAAKTGTPVVLVNRGATRGDELVTAKLDTGCGPWLTALADAVEDCRAG